jgi:hypothetical protein
LWRDLLNAVFGAKAQIVVGALFLAATVAQTVYWETGGRRPDAQAIFLVSMEALAFASYAIIATGLGYRATERVETAVVENIENAEEVTTK